jgi:ribosomal protein S18 acetylase RimI-like enzyme
VRILLQKSLDLLLTSTLSYLEAAASDATAPAKEPQLQYESPDRRDAHHARMTQFRSDMNRAKKEILEKRYGDKELYLGLLACHPDYQGRGAGRELLRWGLEKADEEGLDVTLMTALNGPASPFYKRFGFVEVESFRTQLEGEEEYHDTLTMAREHTRN